MAMTTQAAPIINLFELDIQNGKSAQYDAVGEHNISTSVQDEKGTLAMYSVKQKADANMAYMVEIYADENAYETHRTSAQYKAFLTASPEILTDHKKHTVLEPQFLADKKVQQTDETRTNLVIVDVKPSENEKFKAVVLPEMAKSLNVEPGVLAMYAATVKEQTNRWVFFEIYANDEAYAAHRETPHFKDYLKQTGDMLQDKQSIEIRPTYLGNKGGLAFDGSTNK